MIKQAPLTVGATAATTGLGSDDKGKAMVRKTSTLCSTNMF